jgi:hypothetical protein
MVVLDNFFPRTHLELFSVLVEDFGLLNKFE